jgi:hypothetical protein
MLALFSLATVMANIQGAVAPFASLLPMVMEGAPADTVGQIRRGLADYPGAGGRSHAALEVMISDFARYHAAMAVIVVVVANTGTAADPVPALRAFFDGGW